MWPEDLDSIFTWMLYDNRTECMWELRGMACAVQHMHVMNAEELRIPVPYIWYFTVDWCGARQHLDTLPDLLCIWCIWKATCCMTDRPDIELSTAWLEMVWATCFLHAVCRPRFSSSLLSPFQSWTVSSFSLHIQHASPPALYSFVCWSSCRDLIHSSQQSSSDCSRQKKPQTNARQWYFHVAEQRY